MLGVTNSQRRECVGSYMAEWWQLRHVKVYQSGT